jgi:hypothetical protein
MRFIAVDGWHLRVPVRRPFGIDSLAGGGGTVTTYRTLRNAVDRAGPNGAVWVLEIAPLRRVNFADFQPGTVEYKALARTTERHRKWFENRPHHAPDPEPAPDRAELAAELALAERQMIAWSERAIALEKQLANTE